MDGKRRGFVVPNTRSSELNTFCTEWFGKRWKGHLKFYIMLIFLCLAVLFYHYYEGWTVIECVYFSICTGFTVGYGSPHPSNDASRLYTIFFILGSMILVFEAVNDFARFLLSRVEKRILRQKAQEVSIEDYSLTSRTVVTRGKLKAAVFFLVIMIMIGVLWFMKNEEWSFVTSLYWIISTVSTVGFGDLTPQKESSKVFLIIFIPLSVGLFATTFALLSVMNRHHRVDKHREKILIRPMDRHWMAHIYSEHAGLLSEHGVDKYAFVVSSLLDLGLIEMHDVEPLMKRHSELANSSGYIHVSSDMTVEEDGPTASYGAFKVDNTLSLLSGITPDITPSLCGSDSFGNDQKTPLLSPTERQ